MYEVIGGLSQAFQGPGPVVPAGQTLTHNAAFLPSRTPQQRTTPVTFEDPAAQLVSPVFVLSIGIGGKDKTIDCGNSGTDNTRKDETIDCGNSGTDKTRTDKNRLRQQRHLE